ncbi:MAG: hypothetical protein M3R15_26590 [Acidobacteriota bacterium]|nr:hypothetical protein [Acidobacteriota bacterium]
MNKSQLVQLTRRRQISGSSYEQLIGLLVGEMKQRTAKPQIAASRLSGKYAERIVNSFTAELPECRTCGACCAFYTCVTVVETDAVPRTHYWKIGEHRGCSSATGGRQLRRDPHSNTCVGLEGEIGKAVRCGI